MSKLSTQILLSNKRLYPRSRVTNYHEMCFATLSCLRRRKPMMRTGFKKNIELNYLANSAEKLLGLFQIGSTRSVPLHSWQCPANLCCIQPPAELPGRSVVSHARKLSLSHFGFTKITNFQKTLCTSLINHNLYRFVRSCKIRRRPKPSETNIPNTHGSAEP